MSESCCRRFWVSSFLWLVLSARRLGDRSSSSVPQLQLTGSKNITRLAYKSHSGACQGKHHWNSCIGFDKAAILTYSCSWPDGLTTFVQTHQTWTFCSIRLKLSLVIKAPKPGCWWHEANLKARKSNAIEPVGIAVLLNWVSCTLKLTDYREFWRVQLIRCQFSKATESRPSRGYSYPTC